MDENKNLNPVEQEPEQQAEPVETVEAPVEELWNAPVAELTEEAAEPANEPAEEPAEQPTVLTASNTGENDVPSAPIYVDPSAIFEKNTVDHGYAVASLGVGIVGLVSCCCYGLPAVVMGVIGLILGIMSRKHGNNEGISLAGVIISAISLGLGLVFGAIMVVAIFTAMGEVVYENPDLFGEMYDDYVTLFRPF